MICGNGQAPVSEEATTATEPEPLRRWRLACRHAREPVDHLRIEKRCAQWLLPARSLRRAEGHGVLPLRLFPSARGMQRTEVSYAAAGG